MRLLLIVTYFELVVALPFLGKKTNYDDLTARKLLNMAAGAYGMEQEACINKTFPAREKYVVLSVSSEACDEFDNDCAGYIAVSNVKKELVIVFRGTATMGQLLIEGLRSIRPGMDFFDMGRVNRYFLNGHLVLWPPVERVLTDPKYADYKTVFTGHSLGGALATLAAARAAKQGLRTRENITVYTYGEPRVGDAQFATNYDSMIKDSYRVVNRRDIVPHLPACAKNKSWPGDRKTSRPCDVYVVNKPYHHSTEIWYPVSMEPGSPYIECTGEPRGEDFTCSDRFKLHYHQAISYIWDHNHYFNVRVDDFGKTGCDVLNL
ncbi:Triacylglycerol lipase [Trichostrongylus colubriformis]|uniref:Triacylglycerol lipase n=1 Tax=Trichostrongylus colubriformis TaxID=6319 RepID=A0AAN8IKP5_TRICO